MHLIVAIAVIAFIGTIIVLLLSTIKVSEPLKYGTKVHVISGTYRDLDGKINGSQWGAKYPVNVECGDKIALAYLYDSEFVVKE